MDRSELRPDSSVWMDLAYASLVVIYPVIAIHRSIELPASSLGTMSTHLLDSADIITREFNIEHSSLVATYNTQFNIWYIERLFL